MKIFRSTGLAGHVVDTSTFVGHAHATQLAKDDSGVPIVIYHVAFERGARTNWHIHSGAQWLLVTEGRIRIQKLGEAPEELETGDAVVIAPGEKHWHGAAPGASGVHVAVNVNATTEWLEPVSEDDYTRP